MITVAILINGQPIYTRTAVNVERLTSDENGACRYHCDDGSFITHRRSDGAVRLAKMMLDTIRGQKP